MKKGDYRAENGMPIPWLKFYNKGFLILIFTVINSIIIPQKILKKGGYEVKMEYQDRYLCKKFLTNLP